MTITLTFPPLAHRSRVLAWLIRWLTLPQMEKHLFSGIAVSFFKSRLMKLGLTPKEIFSKHYLTEIPIMAEIAPEHFN